MSAPPSGSSGPTPGAPAPGYYPDPSIPRYVRYWNGSAWVPGTSRPAPADGGAPPAPGVPSQAAPAAGPATGPARGPALDESGPMFLDEDPGAPVAQYGPVPPAGGPLPDPRAPRPGWPAAPGSVGGGAPVPGSVGGGAPVPGPAGVGAPAGGAPGAGSPVQGPPVAGGPTVRPGPQPPSGANPPDAAGARAPFTGPPAAPPGPGAPRVSWGAAQPAGPSAPAAGPFGAEAPPAPFGGTSGPGPNAAGGVTSSAAPAPAPGPGAEGPPGPGAEGPASVPWAAQVQDLARGDGPVVPWKPVAADPFASARGHDRPGGLVRRLLARVVDTVLVGAVTAAAAVPLGSAAYHHAKDKVDEAKLTGQAVRVWLIDGTTGAQLGAVLGVFLVACLLFEVLPTARWGRTAGKRLAGLKVLDIEAQLPPRFSASLRRWLTRTVLDVLVVGVLGVAWCLWDRPWKQGWHDKAARTFVAGD